MICKNCGSECTGNFCTNCGKPIIQAYENPIHSLESAVSIPPKKRVKLWQVLIIMIFTALILALSLWIHIRLFHPNTNQEFNQQIVGTWKTEILLDKNGVTIVPSGMVSLSIDSNYIGTISIQTVKGETKWRYDKFEEGVGYFYVTETTDNEISKDLGYAVYSTDPTTLHNLIWYYNNDSTFVFTKEED